MNRNDLAICRGAIICPASHEGSPLAEEGGHQGQTGGRAVTRGKGGDAVRMHFRGEAVPGSS